MKELKILFHILFIADTLLMSGLVKLECERSEALDPP